MTIHSNREDGAIDDVDRARTSSSTVAVTGGGGFLGRHVVPLLVGRGATVRVVDSADPPDWLRRLDVEVHRADVGDHEAMRKALSGVDTVIHAAFAAPRAAPDRMWAVNVHGTATVCETLESATQLILISSTIVEAEPRPHPLRRDTPLDRLDAYRASRIAAEKVATAAGGPNRRVAVVRPKTFVGPGQVGGFALVFNLIRSGGAVPIAGPGTNRYQLLDTRDLARALGTLVDRGGEGIFGLGATRFGSIADDLSQLIAAAGTGARLRRLPRPVGRALVRGVELAGLAPLAEWHHLTAQGADSVIDVSRAQGELGWEPGHSNAESLVEAYRWFVAAQDRARTTHPVPPSHRALRRAARVLR